MKKCRLDFYPCVNKSLHVFNLVNRPCKATCEEMSSQCEAELLALPDQISSFLNCEDLPTEQVK